MTNRVLDIIRTAYHYAATQIRIGGTYGNLDSQATLSEKKNPTKVTWWSEAYHAVFEITLARRKLGMDAAETEDQHVRNLLVAEGAMKHDLEHATEIFIKAPWPCKKGYRWVRLDPQTFVPLEEIPTAA